MKGQSAIEYLMSYGWMLLVVAVIGGAVFSLAEDQTIESVNGFNTANINIEDFGVSSESGLRFSIRGPLDKTKVTEITVYDKNNQNIKYSLDRDVSEENILSMPGIVPAENTKELEVEITYNSGKLENLSVSGTVNGKLMIDENFDNRNINKKGLIAYYPLEKTYSDSEKIYDLTRNNYHGQKIGEPSFTQDNGLDFDGKDDYINIGDISEFEEGNKITVSAWYKIGPQDTWKSIIAKQGVWRLLISGNGENSEWNVRNVDDEREKIFGSRVADNQWHNQVGTFNGTHLKLYVDGNKVVQESLQGNFNKNDNSVNIGSIDGNSQNIQGTLDEIKIYNRQMSKSEIENLASQTP
jgi:hypothetical protein